jgi:hypothetical protein
MLASDTTFSSRAVCVMACITPNTAAIEVQIARHAEIRFTSISPFYVSNLSCCLWVDAMTRSIFALTEIVALQHFST